MKKFRLHKVADLLTMSSEPRNYQWPLQRFHRLFGDIFPEWEILFVFKDI